MGSYAAFYGWVFLGTFGTRKHPICLDGLLGGHKIRRDQLRPHGFSSFVQCGGANLFVLDMSENEYRHCAPPVSHLVERPWAQSRLSDISHLRANSDSFAS